MNSTSTPKSIEPRDGLVAGEDERLAHAFEQIRHADGELARLSEQVKEMQRDAARPSSAGRGRQLLQGRPGLRALAGMTLAVCIVVAALVFQSSYGGGSKAIVALSSPQPVATPSSPPENPSVPAQPAPSVAQVTAAEAPPPQATPVAQTPPQETAPAAAAASPDQTQFLQTMARDLAKLESSVEQLKATQQQIANDTSKDIAELKASQEEIKRELARVSEQNLSKTLPPPTPPTPTLRKPERTVQPPRVRARPSREWMYDDW